MKEPISRPDGSKIELTQKIGGGANGEVYRSRWTSLDGKVEWVAVKVLKNIGAGETAELANLEREIKNLESASHPNIVKYRDHGLDPKHGHYIITELIDGLSLNKLIENSGPLPESVAYWIIYEVTDALIYLHETKKIIHRDLTPKNIMLDREGRVVLIDFGLARELTGNTVSATLDGLGTPGYFSPEIAKGEKPVFASDVFALGIIFTESLTGKNPYKANTARSMKLAQEADTATECQRLLDEAGFKDASNLVGRILSQVPENRASLSEIEKLSGSDSKIQKFGNDSFPQAWLGVLVCRLCPEEFPTPEAALAPEIKTASHRNRLRRVDYLGAAFIGIFMVAVGSLYMSSKSNTLTVSSPIIGSSPSPSPGAVNESPSSEDYAYPRLFWKDVHGTKEVSPIVPSAPVTAALSYPASREACDQIYSFIMRTLGSGQSSGKSALRGADVLERAKMVLDTKTELSTKDPYCLALKDSLGDLSIYPEDESLREYFQIVFRRNLKIRPDDGTDLTLEKYYLKYVSSGSLSYLESSEIGQFDIFHLSANLFKGRAKTLGLNDETECQAVGDYLYFQQFLPSWLEDEGKEDDSLSILIVPGDSKIRNSGFVKIGVESQPTVSSSQEDADGDRKDAIFKDGMCRYSRVGESVNVSLWTPKYPF